MLKIFQAIFVGDIYLCLSLLEPLSESEAMPITRYRTILEVADRPWWKRLLIVWLLSKLGYIDSFYKGSNPAYIECYSLTETGREYLKNLNQVIDKIKWQDEQENR